jgi:uncharacterized protein YfaS (alpha-2-macroglobulin family)
MLLPFIKDEINVVRLRDYLYNMYNHAAPRDRVLALYGLALLGEPVLLQLQGYAAMTNLSVRDTAYVALALNTIGETHVARQLFNNQIAPHIQNIEPYYRVIINARDPSAANRAEILDATSVVALLAAQLGRPEALGLHNYTVDLRNDAPHRFNADALLLNIERLLFISYEINNHTSSQASITYTMFGDTVTRNLGFGGQFTLRIPAENMHEFDLVSMTGQVSAVSIVRTPLENMNTVSNDISISRVYYRGDTNVRATTFSQNELIRVEITVDYSRVDLSGSYVITDFLPAGLVHVPNSARVSFSNRDNVAGWWTHVMVDGQRITFYDWNGRFNRNHTYYYYARVINPGTFVAEGTMVQSMGAREFMSVGTGTTIRINP